MPSADSQSYCSPRAENIISRVMIPNAPRKNMSRHPVIDNLDDVVVRLNFDNIGQNRSAAKRLVFF